MHSYIKAIRQSTQMLQSYIIGVVEYANYDIIATYSQTGKFDTWNTTMMGVDVRGSATEATHIRLV